MANRSTLLGERLTATRDEEARGEDSSGERVVAEYAATKGSRLDQAKVDVEFSVYLCQAHKWLVLAQCVFYSLDYFLRTVTSFQLDAQTGSYNVSFWEELGVSCKLSPFNCTNAGFEKALYLETAPYAIGYALQMAIFVTVPILIFRPYYQERWDKYSTGLMIAGACTGLVPLEALVTLSIVLNDLIPVLTSKDVSIGGERAIVVGMMILQALQRSAGVTSLQMLAFAPRFKAYAAVCCVLLLTEASIELAAMYFLKAAVVNNSSAWSVYLASYNYSLFGVLTFANVTAYAVPCGLLWIFERLLHNTFLLQKTLEIQSKSLFKQANPFAFRTIKDWVETLAARNGQTNGSSGKPLARTHSQRQSASAYVQLSEAHLNTNRHPWELNASNLEIGAVIGTGSQGLVYKGHYNGTEVAIKTLFSLPSANDQDIDEEQINEKYAQTASEAEALSRLHHVNMMRFFGICFLEKLRTIAMVTELCALDLRTWLSRPDTRQNADKWSITLQIARGLVYLHEDALIVHRDLKPSNILLTADFTVKLCDFGISSAHHARVSTGVDVAGTVEYMPPECFAKASFARASTLSSLRPMDIYAFGCITWEVFSGLVIWDGVGRFEIIQAVQEGERPNLQEVVAGEETNDLRAFIQSCWQAKPQNRPRAREVASTVRVFEAACMARNTTPTAPTPSKAVTGGEQL